MTRLSQLGINCDFDDDNKEIKSQIIQGCSSTRLRRRALREDQTLDNLMKLARSMELSGKQACEIEHSEKSENANAVTFKQKNKTYRKKTYRKVQVGKDQEKAQSEKVSHSKYRGGKKPN